MIGRSILLEGIFSDAERILADFWERNLLIVGFPDGDIHFVIIDIGIPDIPKLAFSDIADRNDECIVECAVYDSPFKLLFLFGQYDTEIATATGRDETLCGFPCASNRHSTSKAKGIFKYMCWVNESVQFIRIDKWKEQPTVCYRVRVHRGSRPLLYRCFPDYQMALMFAHECARNYQNLKAPEPRWWNKADNGL